MNEPPLQSDERSPYRRLLLVLYSALTVLGALAYVSVGSPVFGRARLLPVTATRLTVPAGSGTARTSLKSAPTDSPVQPKPRTVADSGKQRILLFGDSMVPILAPRLADYCLENGHQLYPVVWYGSTIIYWGHEDRLGQLLGEFNPTMVIAALGSSELAVRDVGECEQFVGMIARRVGKRKLVWVGPPNWRRDTGVNSLLERVLGPGRFYRFGNLHLERGTDGIHPSKRGGVVWVDAFVHWLVNDSDFPIQLASPTRAAHSTLARAYPPPH